jgi:hypothetical protein
VFRVFCGSIFFPVGQTVSRMTVARFAGANTLEGQRGNKQRM